MANTPEEQQFFDWFNTLTPEEQAGFQNTYGTGAGAPAAAAPAPEISAPPSTPTPVDPAESRAMFDNLAAYLDSLGLGSLFTVDAQGRPGGWLWDQVTGGIDSEAGLQLALEQTPVYQARYGVIGRLRTRAASGEPLIVPTVQQVREYEQSAAQLMRQTGFPSWFYDNFSDLQGLMEQGYSLPELEHRIGQTWETVANADPHVMQAFEDYYGIQGAGALAAFVLDDQYTLAQLDKYSRAAYTGGMGRAVGLNLDRALSERIADLPTTEAGIVEDLNTVAELQGRGVFSEGWTETADLTAEGEGIGAVVFGDGAAAGAIGRRTLSRRANEVSSTGGAALTQAGLAGAGST